MATNRKSIAEYGPLEKYYHEIQKPEHPNYFTLTQYADPTKYCYGRNDEPCPFSPTPVNDLFHQLTNRAEQHYNGCCLQCCKSSNVYGVCPCSLHFDEARAKYCFGSTRGSCALFHSTGVLQPIHCSGMCLACAKSFNDGSCFCEECCLSINGYICYGTILYDCVYYCAHGNRKVHKKAQTGNICSACSTLWNKLLKFKRKVVNETVIEDGNAIVRTRASLGDPPPVTFREGKTIDHLDTTKPQAYKPSKPIPATIKIQFTPTIIHPWYMVPIRQCLICRTIYHQTLIAESDIFDLCEAVLETGKTIVKIQQRRIGDIFADRREHLYIPNSIYMTLLIPMIFRMAHSRLYFYGQEFLMKFKSKRYKDTLVKVLAGSGRTYIVPDQYYKACQADSTLISYKPYKEHPNWNNLCIDINCVLMDRAQVTANIVINRMDDLSTSPFHLRMALGEFKYPKRTFVVVRSLNRNPNRSGTCAVSDLINLLDSMADFPEISTVAGLCLKSCYEETTAPNKVKNKARSKESDPEMELYSSQPSTQGGSQGSQPLAKSGSFSMSDIMNTIPEEGMEDITMTVENRSEFNYPRMLTLNGGFIEASSVDVVDRNSGEKIFKGGEVVQRLRFASIPESRKPKEKAKKRK